MKLWLAGILFCLVISTNIGWANALTDVKSSGNENCQVALKETKSSLSLEFQAFDQTPNQGWRVLSAMECYPEAAELIVSYLNTSIRASVNERKILSFHAGQMFAYDNDYKSAIPYFKNSFYPKTNISPEFKIYTDAWDAYVRATIAFLEQDRSGLENYRAKVAKGPKLDNGKIMNLEVVDRLLENFGKPYLEAYGKD